MGGKEIEKAKVLMGGVVAVLVVVVAASGLGEILTSVPHPEESYLRVHHVPKCWTGAGWSDNPPYFVGEKYYWWLHTTVRADANVSDVVLSDQVGGEFVIEGISFVPIEKPGPYNYTFEYDAYESGASVRVINGPLVWTGYLDEAGVTFDDLVVYWTDLSLTAHLAWNIGSMGDGDVKELYVTISTDTNPDGLQEFTSPGTHFLNSGATVTGIVASTGEQAGAESTGIDLEVFEKIEQ